MERIDTYVLPAVPCQSASLEGSCTRRQINKISDNSSSLTNHDRQTSESSLDVEVIEMTSSRSLTSRGCLVGIGAAIFYSTCAIGMNFSNKASLMYFPLANIILLFQMLMVVVTVFPLKMLGIIQFPDLSIQKGRQLLPVTVLYSANVSAALLGLQTLNIPMYSTLKRLTPLMIILGKWRIYKTLPQRGILASVSVVLAGCIVAGLGDLSFDLRGYCYALASCTLQASYLLLVEGRGAKRGVSSTELLAYNAVMSIPFLLVVNILTGELWMVTTTFKSAAMITGTMNITILLVFSSIAGMLLNFSLFLCTNVNSALTTTIAGTLKGVIATGLGFFFLGGVEFHTLNVVGIALNTIGGVWYSIIKYRSRKYIDYNKHDELPSHNGGSKTTYIYHESSSPLARVPSVDSAIEHEGMRPSTPLTLDTPGTNLHVKHVHLDSQPGAGLPHINTGGHSYMNTNQGWYPMSFGDQQASERSRLAF